FWNHRIVCWTGYWCDSRRIYRREEDDRRWPSRLGEFAGKSRWNDRQIDDRARDDHDFLYDRAAAILSSSTELTNDRSFLQIILFILSKISGVILAFLCFLADCDKLSAMADDRW